MTSEPTPFPRRTKGEIEWQRVPAGTDPPALEHTGRMGHIGIGASTTQ